MRQSEESKLASRPRWANNWPTYTKGGTFPNRLQSLGYQESCKNVVYYLSKSAASVAVRHRAGAYKNSLRFIFDSCGKIQKKTKTRNSGTNCSPTFGGGGGNLTGRATKARLGVPKSPPRQAFRQTGGRKVSVATFDTRGSS